MFLIDFGIRIIMSILVSFTIIKFLHEFGRSITQMQRNRQITVFFYISSRSKCCTISDIVFFCFGKIDCELKQEDITFRFSDLGNCIIDLIGKQQGIIIRWSNIFRRKAQQSSSQIQWILSSHEHPLDPITGSIAITVTERFVDSGNDVVMFFTISVIIDIFLPCLQNYLINNHSIFRQKYSRFQDIQRIAEIAVAEFSNKKDMIIRQLQVWMFFENQRKFLFDKGKDFFFGQLFEDKHPTSAEQRVIHGETGILRRRSDKDNRSFFYIREQSILLCFVPTMDFIQEYDSGFSILKIGFCLCNQFEQILFFAGNAG